MRVLNYMLIMVFLVSLYNCSKKEEEKEKPSRVLDVSEVTTDMIVKNINLKERLFTLDYGDGNEVVFRTMEDVEGLENIHVGDKVKVTYLRSQAVYVTSPDAESAPAIASNRTVEIDSKEGKPKTLTVKVKEEKSTVEAIDYEKRTAVLKHEDGTLENIDVSPEVKNLENVKIGDIVVLQVTEALAVDISKVEE